HKEYAPRLAELDRRRDAVVTPEREKAARDARKAAAAEGKKGKELNKAYSDALNLTKEEHKQLGEIQRERGKLVKEINEKKMALLTGEQKEMLKSKPKPKKEKEPAK